MRYALATMVLAILAGLGCPAAGTPNHTRTAANTSSGGGGGTVAGGTSGDGQNGAASGSGDSAQPASGGAALTPPDQVKPERRVTAYLDGKSRVMDIDEARAYGFTIIDLSDDWVPYIFWSKTPGKDDFKLNRYQFNYVGLANDKIDVNGAHLGRGHHNYHEVYGIPPSIGVLRKRFLADETKECFKSLDYAFFKNYYGPVRAADPGTSKRYRRRYFSARARYKKALRRAHVRTLDALLAKPRYAGVARHYRAAKWRYEAIRKMQKRLICEGMYNRRRPRIKLGVVKWATRVALRRFERKHNVYGWGMIFQRTSDALGRSPLENNYESLKRVIAERVVSAAGILEDGSVRPSYTGEDGKRHRVRNLVKEFGDVVLRHMGLTSADKAKEWITKTHSAADFKHLFIAVQLPKVPEYYSPNMEFSVIIDRGDVWYDLPFDEKGRRKAQPRSRMPKFTLYIEYKGQRLPLVRWRTTIGGWNKEMRHGEEYYKYKISDVGKRIWKHIAAGPAWVPPKKTPPRDMVKYRVVHGSAQRVVAQSTFGPGYASAYGLAAAYHVTKSGHDNQIRTHGSVNYMSIRGSYSHGCHRLYNFRAVRLFSFVLRHRPFKRLGQIRIAYTNRFEYKGEEFQVNIHTRGYRYELLPPIPVNVLKGRIKGERKEPYEDYLKKPGKMYQSDLVPKGKKGGGMSQPQPL